MHANIALPRFPAAASVPEGAVQALKETDRPSLAQVQAVFGPTAAALTISRAKSLVGQGPVLAIVGQALSGGWTLATRGKKVLTHVHILGVNGSSVRMTVAGKPMFDGDRVFPYVMERGGQKVVVMGSGADAIWVFPPRRPARARGRSRGPSRRPPTATTKPSRSPSRPALRPRRRRQPARPARQASRSKSRRPARR